MEVIFNLSGKNFIIILLYNRFSQVNSIHHVQFGTILIIIL